MKKCGKCQTLKPLLEFCQRRKAKDGRHNRCRSCHAEASRLYRLNNPEKTKESRQRQNKLNYSKNREALIQYQRQYRKTNKQKIQKKRNLYEQKRLKTDTAFRVKKAVRSRIKNTIKSKNIKTIEYLQCSALEFINHLEVFFEPGMSWNNYGSKWHIDHTIPVSAYDLTKINQVIEAFAYYNCKPMWAEDNLKKGAKW